MHDSQTGVLVEVERAINRARVPDDNPATNPAATIELLTRTLETSTPDSFYAVRILQIMGEAHLRQGDSGQAVDCMRAALEETSRFDDPKLARIYRASLYGSLAQIVVASGGDPNDTGCYLQLVLDNLEAAAFKPEEYPDGIRMQVWAKERLNAPNVFGARKHYSLPVSQLFTLPTPGTSGPVDYTKLEAAGYTPGVYLGSPDQTQNPD